MNKNAMTEKAIKQAEEDLKVLEETLLVCEDFEGWHINWVTFDGTFYRAREPDMVRGPAANGLAAQRLEVSCAIPNHAASAVSKCSRP